MAKLIDLVTAGQEQGTAAIEPDIGIQAQPEYRHRAVSHLMRNSILSAGPAGLITIRAVSPRGEVPRRGYGWGGTRFGDRQQLGGGVRGEGGSSESAACGFGGGNAICRASRLMPRNIPLNTMPCSGTTAYQ